MLRVLLCRCVRALQGYRLFVIPQNCLEWNGMTWKAMCMDDSYRISQ